MLPYFEEVVFTRTSKKYVTPDAGYSGVIGLRPKGWKAPNPKEKRIAKQILDVEEWTPGSLPNEPSQEDWTLERAEVAIARSEELDQQDDQYEDEHGAKDTVTLARSVGNTENQEDDMAEAQQDSSVHITLQDELNALGSMVEEDEAGMDLDNQELEPEHEVPAIEQHHSPEPCIIETEADKQRVFSGLVPDKYGRINITVPLTLGTVDNYRKACIYLWKLQSQRTTLCPNPAPNPRSDSPLNAAISDYGVRLVYAKASIGTTRDTLCEARDTYDGNKLVRMAMYTWKQQPVHRTKGIRKYSSITRFPYIRERLCILARHHMLLSDEDIRNLNFSDVFSTLNCKNATGSTWACGLTFCLRRDRPNKKGAMLYATAFRHKDFRRCTVGAFAFYMLERFMVCIYSVNSYCL
ncbi:MAG: hypothetical protein J3R72DRAFT_231522 [Linnemannia gamsii]|nr:MAG: hypothetical protein J3R72DRAFT_231522 [Linnemannia gamsii]